MLEKEMRPEAGLFYVCHVWPSGYERHPVIKDRNVSWTYAVVNRCFQVFFFIATNLTSYLHLFNILNSFTALSRTLPCRILIQVSCYQFFKRKQKPVAILISPDYFSACSNRRI